MTSGVSRGTNNLVSDAPAEDDQRAAETRQERRLQQVVSQIEESLRGLRYGQVTITVQDGVVVQIDRLERTRIQRTTE